MTLRLVAAPRFIGAALLVLSLSVGAAVAQGGDGHGLDELRDRGILGSLRAVHSGSESLGLATFALALAPTPTPTKVVSVVQRSSVSEVQTFLAGFDAHGGRPEWRARFVEVVQCESTWRPLAVSEAGHLGLGSFHPDTWRRVWELVGMPVQDWRSPFWQGAATAIWSNEVGPEPPAGWSCW